MQTAVTFACVCTVHSRGPSPGSQVGNACARARAAGTDSARVAHVSLRCNDATRRNSTSGGRPLSLPADLGARARARARYPPRGLAPPTMYSRKSVVMPTCRHMGGGRGGGGSGKARWLRGQPTPAKGTDRWRHCMPVDDANGLYHCKYECLFCHPRSRRASLKLPALPSPAPPPPFAKPDTKHANGAAFVAGTRNMNHWWPYSPP